VIIVLNRTVVSSEFFSTQSPRMDDAAPSGQQPRRYRKGNTDPFQMFCVEYRPSVAAANPGASVGTVTSVLGSMWRAMPREGKAPYAAFAKDFDASPRPRRPPRPPPLPAPAVHVEPGLSVPSIHVVKRTGCSDCVEEISLASLIQAMKPGNP
jgi:hypothetical protein